METPPVSLKATLQLPHTDDDPKSFAKLRSKPCKILPWGFDRAEALECFNWPEVVGAPKSSTVEWSMVDAKGIVGCGSLEG